jgi:hypothetical protein
MTRAISEDLVARPAKFVPDVFWRFALAGKRGCLTFEVQDWPISSQQRGCSAQHPSLATLNVDLDENGTCDHEGALVDEAIEAPKTNESAALRIIVVMAKHPREAGYRAPERANRNDELPVGIPLGRGHLQDNASWIRTEGPAEQLRSPRVRFDGDDPRIPAGMLPEKPCVTACIRAHINDRQGSTRDGAKEGDCCRVLGWSEATCRSQETVVQDMEEILAASAEDRDESATHQGSESVEKAGPPPHDVTHLLASPLR